MAFWECSVELNEEFVIQHLSEQDKPFTTLIAMKEMILYWATGAEQLEENAGSVSRTFLQMLAREMFIILSGNRLNENGVIAEFKNKEGWCPMDGSWGIKITYVESIDISWRDFEVDEVI